MGCREDHLKEKELEKAYKAGLAAPEVDGDGEEINPHIPKFMSSAPWYVGSEKPSLKHQKNWKIDPAVSTDASCDRGAKVYQAENYRKGACENCGAITHNLKDCLARPRVVGAKFTNKNIAPDEKIQNVKLLSYDAKRDPSNGYVFSTYYHRMAEAHKAKEEARKKFLKEEKLKKLEEENKNQEGNDATSSDCDEEDEDLRVDEAKVDESKQMDFAKVEKRVRTIGGGSTGTVRNLRIREEIPMELLLGQSEKQVEYDRAGRIIKGQEVIMAQSKYEEDVHASNHTSVWGSWWKGHQWGYKCCQQTIRNSYCTGSAGIEAAEGLMKANIARKEASEERPKDVEEKRMATWGTDISDDLELDDESLANALKKEDECKTEEKYDNNDVTPEEMEE